MKEITLFDAQVPYRGLRTSVDATAVPNGYLTSAQNIRYDDRTLRLRSGQTLLANASSLSGTCIGSTIVTNNSFTYYFIALNVSGSVRIYCDRWNGSSWNGSWVEVTASSGKYGNTRMTAPSTGFVIFDTVYDTEEGLCVIAQDGTSDPRIIKIGQSSPIASGSARIIKTIAAPESSSGLTPVFGFSSKFNPALSTDSISSSGTSLAWTAPGSPKYWTLTVAGSTAGDYSQIGQTSMLGINGGGQLVFLVEMSSETFINSCKWEIIGSLGNYTIHDPANNLDNAVVVESNIPGYKLLAFSLGGASPPYWGGGGSIVGTMNAIRVTVSSPSIVSGATLNVHGIFTGGRVPGTTQYAVTWRNSNSFTESPPVVLPVSVEGGGKAYLTGSAQSSIPDDFRIPISTAIYYTPYVSVTAPPQSLVDLGVDHIRVYRREPGESTYTYSGQTQCAEYSGSAWVYSSPFTSSNLNGVYVDTVPSYDRDEDKIAPGDFNQAVPIGRAAHWAGSRYYVGSFKASSSERKSVVYVSDEKHPFRFRTIGSGDPESGFSAQLDGEEEVRAFISSSASVIGSATVYCFSDRATYAIDGPLIRRVSGIGCVAPTAIAENQGRIFFLDQNRQVRMMQSNITDLSRGRVDNILTGASSVDKAVFVFHRDRLYISYLDGSTRKLLVWSEIIGDWESIDVCGVQPTFPLIWRSGFDAKLYFASPDGSLYEHESGTQDAGSDIAWQLTSPFLHTSKWDKFTLRGLSIVASDVNSKTATTTYTAMANLSGDVSSATGTINLDSTTSQFHRRDKDANGNDPAVSGGACKVSISGTNASPFRIYGINLNADAKSGLRPESA